jgi:hypothetical protein
LYKLYDRRFCHKYPALLILELVKEVHSAGYFLDKCTLSVVLAEDTVHDGWHLDPEHSKGLKQY